MARRKRGYVDESGVHHNDEGPLIRRQGRIAFLLWRIRSALEGRGDEIALRHRGRRSDEDMAATDWQTAGTIVGDPYAEGAVRHRWKIVRRGQQPYGVNNREREEE